MKTMKLKIGDEELKGYDFTVTENRIQFKRPDGELTARAINGRGFSFEPVETRGWIVVIGTASGNFWAQHESTLLGSEVVVQDNLTEEEACELSRELRETRDKYRF